MRNAKLLSDGRMGDVIRCAPRSRSSGHASPGSPIWLRVSEVQ